MRKELAPKRWTRGTESDELTIESNELNDGNGLEAKKARTTAQLARLARVDQSKRRKSPRRR